MSFLEEVGIGLGFWVALSLLAGVAWIVFAEIQRWRERRRRRRAVQVDLRRRGCS
jgi:hypothetical protein